MTNSVPVIFRKFQEGDVIALYPTLPYAHNLDEIISYQVIGEHGAASRILIDELEPASIEEAEELIVALQLHEGFDNLVLTDKYLNSEGIAALNDFVTDHIEAFEAIPTEFEFEIEGEEVLFNFNEILAYTDNAILDQFSAKKPFGMPRP